ncbi:DJ-1/PfpI family protein [Chitinophaga arvensicola]|uniref:Putative intracellular protease/amidase n=1 Tax=Chitinophaga arvensicola TaxID=29529 RepID=A0A1I0Q3C4_9BACT|nr:DJ-1/PfpI family protein [Chitinophaga arvensicola]SEW21435.1 Putative intracellular protease/amidase [Chitinophaga arvensicola]
MNQLRNCYVFVFEGYSDWEPALAMYGIGTFTDVNIVTFSLTGEAVSSGGKLQVQPQASLAQALEADIDLLILPGGEAMEHGANTELIPLIEQLLAQQKTIAAICGATSLLAQHGFLDHITHTSNNLEVLKMMAPDYKGAAQYQDIPAVADKQVITASGTAMIPFAKAIFQHFNLLETENLQFWFNFFDNNAVLPEMLPALSFHFFYQRYETNYQGMMALVRTAIREVYLEAAKAGLEVCGAPAWHYHNFDGQPDTIFTLDIGLPVTSVLPVSAPWHCETLPPFNCVSMQHRGQWDKLADTYGSLFAGLQLLNKQPNGYTREQYLRYNFEQPEQNITNIQIGLQ